MGLEAISGCRGFRGGEGNPGGLADISDQLAVFILILNVFDIQPLNELADLAAEALSQHRLVVVLHQRLPRQLYYVLLSGDTMFNKGGRELPLLFVAQVARPHEQLKVLLDPHVDRMCGRNEARKCLT